MDWRKFAKLIQLVLVVTTLCWAASETIRAQSMGQVDQSGMPKMRSTTQAQRKAAAKNKKRAGLTRLGAAATQKAAGAAQTAGALAAAAPVPGGTPDYFGAYSNWAISPLPMGPVTSITLTSGGSGYCATAAATITDVYGMGSGASASVTVDPTTGAVTGIAVGSPGNGYAGPVVTITDCVGGTGTGATASATITGATSYSGGLKKFIDTLPDLTQIVAHPDIVTYPGTDYYEIELVEYNWQFHTDLTTPTRLRGYHQTNLGTDTAACGGAAQPACTSTDNTAAPPPVSYLGPVIIATKGRPTRIKFTNNLPLTGAGGDLFIPVDTTVMGAGTGYDPKTLTSGTYPQNRGTLHLHGGFTPWISDGTPHQWVTPPGETGPLTTGVSTQPVPDVDLPAGNSMTFYWPNQQSGRLMFYHDHAYGITRLNVYAGEAAGYLLVDPVERGLTDGITTAGVPPMADVPLVIQDKTFVWGSQASGTGTWATDPTWNWGSAEGSLWFPHVYMPNQNPWDITGANAMGRWDYALWFWPPFTGLIAHGTVPNPYYDPLNAPWEPPEIPGTPNPSLVPEAFVDTPVVNGKAYPTTLVDPKPYRLRILNACNDRFLNLSFFLSDPLATTTTGVAGTEVKMVPFNSSQNLITPFPSWWYTPGLNFTFDDRAGGVPDPTTRGPAMIQIGTEGGLLPAPALIRNQPVNYTYNRRDIVVLNVQEKALFLGPAERADVVVDFSNFAGKTLILYNDAPAPVPAADQRIDYYTGGADQTDTGGAPPTLPGYGPNTRTVMQIVVGTTGGTSSAPVDDYNPALLSALNAALSPAFAASQDPIVVPQVAYNAAYPSSPTAVDVPGSNVSRISDTSLTFTPLFASTGLTIPMEPKAIQELFELDYGRMNATLGLELKFTNGGNQTTLPFGYIDPATELIDTSAAPAPPASGDGTQIWKITHNGVDTHAIHVHLFNVQVLNRVGWDGAIRRPDPNELGWKETVRMNPLEDIIVALRPTTPKLPFGLPDSVRLLDVTSPPGTSGQFAPLDPLGNPVTTVNNFVNFGWEYVWHCHLLGHEENDMMRPTVFNTLRALPAAPTPLTLLQAGGQVTLNWTDTTPFDYVTGLPAATLGNPANEIGFRIERASGSGAFTTVALALANATTFVDTYTPPAGTNTTYRVFAYNAAGDSLPAVAALIVLVPPAAPTGLTARVTGMNPPAVGLTWVDNATNEDGFTLQRATNATFTTNLITFTAPANATTYSDTTVVRGTRYYYRVRAFNLAVPVGTSAWSNVVNLLVQISFVRVRAATPQTPTAVVNLAYQAAQAAGNLNIVVVGWNDTVSSVQSVADNRGNVYNLAVGPTTGTGLRQSIYYAGNIVGGATTVTVTFNQPAVFVDVRILEYSGVNTLDVTRAAFGTGTALNSGSATTTAANELVFGAATVSTGTAPGAGFTARIITTPDADLAEDRIVTATGTFSATATESPSGNWVMQMATFK